MRFDPQRHHRPFSSAQGRRSVRLKGSDYAQPGAYIVTICTHRREALFGEILDGEMRIDRRGEQVRKMARGWEHLSVVRQLKGLPD